MALVQGIHVSATSAVIGAVAFLATGLGAGVGLHRYFTHRAFVCGPKLRTVLAILGTSAWQGPISQWVADHRRHHRFADTPLDPHSPHWRNEEPPKSVAGGLLHAHLGWMVLGDVSAPSRYAADIINDPISRLVSRFYWPIAILTLVLPACLGGLIGGREEAISCLVFAGFARVAAVQHLTWAIASFGHRFGEKLPEGKDESRNSKILAVLLMGEGLHSFHHCNPSLGVNQPEALDLGGKILIGLERRRWISNLKR
ncbi:MAG: acyl-CoA desaturase [Myxococcota bacterium]